MREEQGHLGALWKMQDDPRVTRVGRSSVATRSTSSQLFNVLRGEMSLVGAGPQQEWEVALYANAVERRLLVPPGMTGLWQVSGRSDLSCEEAVRLDLYYVENWSVLADLEILVKTLRAVVRSRTAPTDRPGSAGRSNGTPEVLASVPAEPDRGQGRDHERGVGGLAPVLALVAVTEPRLPTPEPV